MADTPDTLIDEHIALLAEARRERDYFMQNAADLAKALSAEQALNAELLAALKAMQNWAAKFESMLEYESLKDEKQFGKEHQETWQLIKRAESQQ